MQSQIVFLDDCNNNEDVNCSISKKDFDEVARKFSERMSKDNEKIVMTTMEYKVIQGERNYGSKR